MDAKKQQGSVLLICLIAMLISFQCCVYLIEEFVDLQSSLMDWTSQQHTQQQLLKKAQQWYKFDFQWQDLGQYACIVICQPDCKGTHHGLVSLSLNEWTMVLRVARPVDDLKCEKRNMIQLPNDILYHRFKRS